MQDNEYGNAATTSALIINALESRFKAEYDAAVAQLSVYVNSYAGVPDHAGIVDDCADLVEQLTSAEDKLRAVRKLFVAKESAEANND